MLISISNTEEVRRNMKKKFLAICLAAVMGFTVLAGCSRPAAEETTAAEAVQETTETPTAEETSGIKVIEIAGEDKDKTISLRIVDRDNPALPGREVAENEAGTLHYGVVSEPDRDHSAGDPPDRPADGGLRHAFDDGQRRRTPTGCQSDEPGAESAEIRGDDRKEFSRSGQY